MNPEQVTAEVIQVLLASADTAYGEAGVSQLAHSLQAAQSAREAGADEELILAALLHDIGRTLPCPDVGSNQAARPLSPLERTTAWLAHRGFSSRLLLLVEGQVMAGRYLAATNANYVRRLSPFGMALLHQEGGPMPREELAQFSASSTSKELLRLRSWVDLAKTPGRLVTPLESYRDLLLRHLEKTARPVQQA